MGNGRLDGRMSSPENREKISVEEEKDQMCIQHGLKTPESDCREKTTQSKPNKQRKWIESKTPEAKEEEEEDLIFLPVSLELDNLKDWAVAGSEGERGALVDVNNRQVPSLLNPLIR